MTFRYARTIAMKELVTATFAVEHLLRSQAHGGGGEDP